MFVYVCVDFTEQFRAPTYRMDVTGLFARRLTRTILLVSHRVSGRYRSICLSAHPNHRCCARDRNPCRLSKPTFAFLRGSTCLVASGELPSALPRSWRSCRPGLSLADHRLFLFSITIVANQGCGVTRYSVSLYQRSGGDRACTIGVTY